MPEVLTTPKAAISGLSVVGRSFVTTSPFSTAASWAASSCTTLRRKGRGGGSWAGETSGVRTAPRQDTSAPANDRFETTLLLDFSLLDGPRPGLWGTGGGAAWRHYELTSSSGRWAWRPAAVGECAERLPDSRRGPAPVSLPDLLLDFDPSMSRRSRRAATSTSPPRACSRGRLRVPPPGFAGPSRCLLLGYPGATALVFETLVGQAARPRGGRRGARGEPRAALPSSRAWPSGGAVFGRLGRPGRAVRSGSTRGSRPAAAISGVSRPPWPSRASPRSTSRFGTTVGPLAWVTAGRASWVSRRS